MLNASIVGIGWWGQKIVSAVPGKSPCLLHIEGHYSNENTSKHFSSWRTDPAEAPAARLTGSGIHVFGTGGSAEAIVKTNWWFV